MNQKAFIVVKALIRKEDKFLLLKKAKGDSSPSAGWETPGGHLEEGEELLAGLAREIQEETGLDVKVLFPFNVYWVQTESKESLIGINYLAEWQSGEPVISDEHNQCQWASIAEMRLLSESKGLQKEIDAYEMFIEKIKDS